MKIIYIWMYELISNSKYSCKYKKIRKLKIYLVHGHIYSRLKILFY